MHCACGVQKKCYVSKLLNYGLLSCFVKHLTRLVHQCSTRLQKFTTPGGRPIISGCDGPTERLSAFVGKLLQTIAKEQETYHKDSTDFINFIEKTRVPENAIIVSMDITSLYTNIPQEEGIETVCTLSSISFLNVLMRKSINVPEVALLAGYLLGNVKKFAASFMYCACVSKCRN